MHLHYRDLPVFQPNVINKKKNYYKTYFLLNTKTNFWDISRLDTA